MSSRNLELTEEEQAALEAIIRNRRAWIAGLGVEVVERLVVAQIVVLWATDSQGRPLEGGPYATLTPYGAEQLGVELRERRWIKWVHQAGYHERMLIEEPYWVRIGRPQRAFVLPGQARQCGLDYPELVPDPAEGPEYLVDEEGSPITLLGGHEVVIDPRLGRFPLRSGNDSNVNDRLR
jgi:hypothetical protein